MTATNYRLGRRKDGYWQKRIDGKLHYFGPKGISETKAVEQLIAFLRDRNSAVVVAPVADITVKEVADRFAFARQPEVAYSTWRQYDDAIKHFVRIVGRDTPVANLTAERFKAVRNFWRQKYGVHRQGSYVQTIRTMMKWAVDNLLIDKAPHFGPEFRKPKQTEVRKSRQVLNERRGQRKFTDAELRKIMRVVKFPVRAFVLLGMNAGMYSADISALKWSELHRRGKAWTVERERGKTGIPQRFVLWPETLTEIRKSRRLMGLDRVFTTLHGNEWNDLRGRDAIGREFDRVLTRLKIKREGVGFGSFRHTYISAVNDHADRISVSMARGHKVEGIDEHYDFPSVERMQSVANLARKRLLNTSMARASTRPGVSSASRRKR